MAATLFADILKSGKTSQGFRFGDVETRDWFRDKALSTMKSDIPDPETFLQGMEDAKSNNVKRPRPGRMLMYHYDPKWKKELPYYDNFPVIFPVKVYQDRFLGLNMHYLPPVYRARLMDALYDVLNNDRYDATSRLKMSYKLLDNASQFKYFKPCVKMYLNSHVRTRLVEVHIKEWDYVLMLPIARFKKAGERSVWDDSIRKIMNSAR